MIKVNGERIDIDKIRLIDFLTENGYDNKAIAVEVNELIVPKAQYASTLLHDGDCVEIVTLVGGG